jgi:fructokinase
LDTDESVLFNYLDMRRVYAIGETVLDIIFKHGQPQAAKAGGAMLNSSVSMGRAGIPVSFISEYGRDDVGDLIDAFLIENGVDTAYVYKFSEGKTVLALAFLNDRNDASYSFYKQYPPDRLAIQLPVPQKDDIVLCGSFYAIWTEIRDRFVEFVSAAKKNGAMVIYDPNFRKAHLSDLEKLKPYILENMRMASLVRASNEDMLNIFSASSVEQAYTAMSRFCPNLIYTASVEGVYVKTSHFSGKFPVQQIQPTSTIGAGDNFNAGMITALYRHGFTCEDIPMLGEAGWANITKTAVAFATHVCMSYENYISAEFAKQV